MLKNFASTVKWMYDNMKGFKLSLLLLTILVSIVSLSNIAIAVISKKLVDAATVGDTSFIYGLLIAYIVFIIAEISIGFVNSLMYINVWQNFSISIRLKLYQKLVKSKWLEFNKLHSGDYVSRLIQDAASVTSGIVDEIPKILSSTVKFIAAFCVMAYYQPIIALFAFIFGPIAFFITRIYSKKLKDTYKSIKEADSDVQEKLQEFFHNIQIVKAFNLEEPSGNILEKIYIGRKKLVIKNSILGYIVNMIKSTGYWGGYFLAFSIGIFGISSGEMSFGVLVVFLQLFNQIQGPLSGIAGSIPRMTASFASAERLIEMEKLESDEFSTHLDMPSSISIIMEDVGFSYPGKEKQLVNINFRAEPGEIALLMGKSGSGKTTLIRLILSLISPDNGKIKFVDNLNNEVLANAEYRKWTSYVPQGNSLFSGTIASNIRYGNPSASDEEIISALISSDAWDFISDLKDGIYAEIGESGVGISEGQAQRIAIARALVSKAPAVIFDEATSGLDAETERKVMENIKKDFINKTFIVITHREAVKKYSDRIYHLQNGVLLQE